VENKCKFGLLKLSFKICWTAQKQGFYFSNTLLKKELNFADSSLLSNISIPRKAPNLFEFHRKQFGTILRMVLAVVLLFFLLRRIGISELQQVLQRVEPTFLTLLFLFLGMDAALRSFNWWLLLESMPRRPPISGLLYCYLAGGFFGTFIPSSLGTDFSRALLATRRYGIDTASSAVAMLVLNLINLLGLCLFALFSCVLLFGADGGEAIIWVLGPCALTYCILFPILLRGWRSLALRGKSFLRDRIVPILNRFATALKQYNDRQPLLVRSLGIALLNQSIGIFAVYCVSLSLGLNVPLYLVAALVPTISLSRLVPMSIAGIGGEQGIFVLLFLQFGIAPAESFTMSLLLSLSNLCFVLFGGALYFLDSFKSLLHDR
jgi:uncharacterized protein (TIRG00374 family)